MSYIRSEAEFEDAVRRLAQARDIERQQRLELAEMGLAPEQIEGVLQPGRVFHAQLEDEIAWYERARSRIFPSVTRLSDIGPLLIALRIGNRWSQRDLATRLGVSDAAVSRDENNEYHGITLERAQRILDTLGASIKLEVEGTIRQEQRSSSVPDHAPNESEFMSLRLH